MVGWIFAQYEVQGAIGCRNALREMEFVARKEFKVIRAPRKGPSPDIDTMSLEKQVGDPDARNVVIIT